MLHLQLPSKQLLGQKTVASIKPINRKIWRRSNVSPFVEFYQPWLQATPKKGRMEGEREGQEETERRQEAAFHVGEVTRDAELRYRSTLYNMYTKPSYA